jgi:RNA methyltransferase, TrmH family
MQAISSFQNPKIKLANKLLNKRAREEEKLFLVDYARDLERAIEHGYQLEYAFYCPALASNEDKTLLAKLDETLLYEIGKDLMTKASYRENPGGLVAVMQQKAPQGIVEAKLNQSPHVLAMVDLRKPGNIGALLRTADAAGIGMICLIDSSLDLYNPNIIRASTGAVFLENIYQMSSTEAFAFFEQAQISIVAAHLAGQKSLYDLDFTAQRTAIVLGTEDEGLDEQWVYHCDALVKIPMMGSLADSLNVSVSGAIFMYEALRQRLKQKA